MGYDIAALSLGLTYEKLSLMDRAPSAEQLKTCTGTFQFGFDFYQANAKVTIVGDGRELSLRWPSGGASALLPVGPDHFVDRLNWQDVKIERDSAGKPTALVYDRFRGTIIQPM